MKFFLVPGKGAVLLGLWDTGWLDLLNIKCNTIDIPPRKKTDKY